MQGPVRRIGARAIALAALALVAGPPPRWAAAQLHSGSNGVYGGYVASDAWFASMRSSAFARSSNASWRANIQRGLDSGKFVEVSLRVAFPGGNPFPRGRVADLSVTGPDGDVWAQPDGSTDHSTGASYYLILKKGATYDIAWMGYFGGKEKFSTLKVLPDNRKRRSVEISYSPRSSSRQEQPGTANPANPSSGTTPYTPPPIGEGYVKPTVGPGYMPPQVGPGYVPPQAGPGYVPPTVGPGYVAPQVGPGYVPPGSR